jgi:hypothetical protein
MAERDIAPRSHVAALIAPISKAISNVGQD